MTELPKIILGIPGYWETRDEFKEAMVRKGNGYLYAGNHIVNLHNPGRLIEVELHGHNPYVAEAFAIAGNGSFSETDMNDLQNHKSIVYLLADGGSLENVLSIMEAASAVLHAGGIAVNVESSGRARTKKDWLEIAGSEEMASVLTAFIQMARENDVFYTSGMHCFGYPDVMTTSEKITGREVEELFSVFCLYHLMESPTMKDGETFSLDPDAPIYLLKKEQCTMFEADEPFYNPYGVWNLVPHRPSGKR